MRKALLVSALLLSACNADLPESSADGRGMLHETSGLTAARESRLGPAEDALAWVRANAPVLGLSTAHDDFRVTNAHVASDGLNHVRLQQMHRGLPVWGADLVVHLDDASLRGTAGNAVSISELDVQPSLPALDASAIAKADHARGSTARTKLSYTREQQELVVFPVSEGDAHLAWHVVFGTESQAGLAPGLFHYFIDAHDGSLLEHWNAMPGMRSASLSSPVALPTTQLANVASATVFTASGPGGNPRVSRMWTNKLEVTESGAGYVMASPRVRTTDMKGSTSGSGTLVSSTSLNFGDPAANDAHGFAQVTLDMLRDWFGHNSIDDNGMLIESHVHYNHNYGNAYWDGQELIYGDGEGQVFYSLTGALDIAAGELAHGFTERHSNLVYTGMGGGMNMAFSYIAGTAAKFYFDPTRADFNIAGDVLRTADALFYMCTPTKDGNSIDNAKNYNPTLDIHYVAGVMSKAFCRAAKRLSGADPDSGVATADGVRRAAQAWFLANGSYWTASSTFTQGCQGVVDAAGALGYSSDDVQAIVSSWADVGVQCAVKAKCIPQCSGKQCGSDGCGGSCGGCAVGQACVNDAQCACVPHCSGKSCGSDGCGGSCGTCGPNSSCVSDAQCMCIPQCDGKSCGPDGCGGICGSCDQGERCKDGACVPSCHTPAQCCRLDGGSWVKGKCVWI